MEEKKNKFKSEVWDNGKTRGVFIAVVAIISVVLIVGIYNATKTNRQNSAIAGSVSLPYTPNVETKIGSSTSETYNNLQRKTNEESAKKALESNQSFLPTLTNNGKSNGFEDPAAGRKLKDEQMTSSVAQVSSEMNRNAAYVDSDKVVMENVPIIVPVQYVETPQVQQQQQPVYVAPLKQKKQGFELSDADLRIMPTLTQMWRNKGSTIEQDFTGKIPTAPNFVNSNNNSANNFTNNNNNNNNNNNQDKYPTLRGGDIIQAVLETAINSDEPSPILAKVVTGPLKGARLIGTMSKNKETVTVIFNTISIPSQRKTQTLSAYAVDPTNQRTTITGDVNNHYFQRYGVMLAATFISAYASALTRQNTVITTGPLGNVTQTTGELTNSQINRQALGPVGAQIANEISKNGSNQPTITIPSGSAIGILIMTDFFLDDN